MKMSGSIRRTERKTGRSVGSPTLRPLFALPEETARPGLDVHLSGPGHFYPGCRSNTVRTVPEWVALPCRSISYFIPLERKTRCGARGGNSHE